MGVASSPKCGTIERKYPPEDWVPGFWFDSRFTFK